MINTNKDPYDVYFENQIVSEVLLGIDDLVGQSYITNEEVLIVKDVIDLTPKDNDYCDYQYDVILKSETSVEYLIEIKRWGNILIFTKANINFN